MNAFDRLFLDLSTGKLGQIGMQNAIRAWVRSRNDLPDGIKDLLCGRGERDPGLLYRLFPPIANIIGTVELAYRRGYEAGLEDCGKPVRSGRKAVRNGKKVAVRIE